MVCVAGNEGNRNVTEWIRICLQCQRNKIHRHNKLQSEQFPITRFDHIHLGIVGPLPVIQGYRYCVMIDRYMRWPDATPVLDVSTEKVPDAVGNT